MRRIGHRRKGRDGGCARITHIGISFPKNNTPIHGHGHDSHWLALEADRKRRAATILVTNGFVWLCFDRPKMEKCQVLICFGICFSLSPLICLDQLQSFGNIRAHTRREIHPWTYTPAERPLIGIEKRNTDRSSLSKPWTLIDAWHHYIRGEQSQQKKLHAAFNSTPAARVRIHIVSQFKFEKQCRSQEKNTSRHTHRPSRDRLWRNISERR